jgi:hypothetical protein
MKVQRSESVIELQVNGTADCAISVSVADKEGIARQHRMSNIRRHEFLGTTNHFHPDAARFP